MKLTVPSPSYTSRSLVAYLGVVVPNPCILALEPECAQLVDGVSVGIEGERGLF